MSLNVYIASTRCPRKKNNISAVKKHVNTHQTLGDVWLFLCATIESELFSLWIILLIFPQCWRYLHTSRHSIPSHCSAPVHTLAPHGGRFTHILTTVRIRISNTKGPEQGLAHSHEKTHSFPFSFSQMHAFTHARPRAHTNRTAYIIACVFLSGAGSGGRDWLVCACVTGGPHLSTLLHGLCADAI